MTSIETFGGGGTSYAISGGLQQASNAYAGLQNVVSIQLLVPAQAGLSVSTDLSLPTDAEIDSATFTVSAEAAPYATLSGVAEVRDAEPPDEGAAAVTVDFGRLVTVSYLGLPGGVTQLYRWDGTGFTSFHTGDGGFPEISTERLLAEFDAPVDVDDVREGATVSLPAVPTGLELLVDGTTVWFERQGSTAGVEAPETTGVGYGIDRTEALREAFARKPGGPVRIELRASTPGELSLGQSVTHHRVHLVAFPEGASRTVDLAEEGPFTVELPLPDDSATWEIDEVRMVLRGDLAPARILPAEGPALAYDAIAVLAPARTVLAKLPAGLLARFDTLGAVRLSLRAPAADSELAGRILADAAGRPGDVVKGGDLTPVRVAAGGLAAWATLTTAAPVASEEALWLELTVSYGEIEWMLTGNRSDDPTAPGAVLYRRLAGGAVREFPTLVDLGPRLGAIRLVGEAPTNQPIAALVLDVGTDAPVELTPGGTDTRAVVGLPTPLAPEGAVVSLAALGRATGSVTFTDVRVVYRE